MKTQTQTIEHLARVRVQNRALGSRPDRGDGAGPLNKVTSMPATCVPAFIRAYTVDRESPVRCSTSGQRRRRVAIGSSPSRAKIALRENVPKRCRRARCTKGSRSPAACSGKARAAKGIISVLTEDPHGLAGDPELLRRAGATCTERPLRPGAATAPASTWTDLRVPVRTAGPGVPPQVADPVRTRGEPPTERAAHLLLSHDEPAIAASGRKDRSGIQTCAEALRRTPPGTPRAVRLDCGHDPARLPHGDVRQSCIADPGSRTALTASTRGPRPTTTWRSGRSPEASPA